MGKKKIVCFYDHETNKLVSWDTIRESWRENIADGGIDDCTFAEYIIMITDSYLGFCAPVYDLNDIVIYDTLAFFRDNDDNTSDCRTATKEDIQ